jgi:hypothetical protein
MMMPMPRPHDKPISNHLATDTFLLSWLLNSQFPIPIFQLSNTQSSIMTFSIDDELTWKVTTENPIREVDNMDWERCAALHNLMLRLSWAVSGKSETEMPRTAWWQEHFTDPALEAEWTLVTIPQAIPSSSL